MSGWLKIEKNGGLRTQNDSEMENYSNWLYMENDSCWLQMENVSGR